MKLSNGGVEGGVVGTTYSVYSPTKAIRSTKKVTIRKKGGAGASSVIALI